jgi:cytoskeletal protein CcmA (bactofilin family)
MFSKSKSPSPQNAQSHTAGSQPAQQAAPASASPRQAKSSPGVPSIISPDLTITGDLNSAGDIQVDVTADTLTIGEQGQVEGKVRGERVRVCGTIEGEIEGGTVTLAASARVLGDIVHDSLAIEPGAHLEGHCRRRGAAKAQGTARETGQAKSGKSAQQAAKSSDDDTTAETAAGSSAQKSAPVSNGSAAGIS